MTPPTLPLVDPNQLADAGQLSALKQAAAKRSPQALREAARQFESLFVSMVLKSMQQANFKDPLFGSDQGDLYQDMYDDQMAAVMSRGKGLGLADMLVQQLRREGAGATDAPGASKPLSQPAREPAQGPNASPGGAAAIGRATSPPPAAARGAATTAESDASCPSGARQAAFARALWPDARQAARQLGVNPVTLLAQAALETNWGRSVPGDGAGGTSHNLFGIKAGSAWSGPAVSSSTQEYSSGLASTVKAQFRSYDSTRQCFQDYVDLLKGSARYTAALGTGNDVQAFGSALQEAGYATDPAYARKLTAVAGTLARALTRTAAAAAFGATGRGAQQPAPLKFAATLPTPAGSGTLQRR